MYDSRRLRRRNRFAGGSLVTFASILVRLQAKREGSDFVLAPFNKFMLCIFLASSAGENLLTAALCLQAKREGGDYVLASLNKLKRV